MRLPEAATARSLIFILDLTGSIRVSLHVMAQKPATQTKTVTAAQPPASPIPSAIVPRRGIKAGRRPNAYPELDYQVVSAALEVHPTWLGRVLNGRFRPSMQMASKLAAYMGWTLDQVNAFYRPKLKTTKPKVSKGKPNAASRNNRAVTGISKHRRKG